MDIAIIGGGPVGCYAASLLAEEHTVIIYENHASIGSPIQCTGLLTADFDQFGFPMESFLVNTFSQVKVYSQKNALTINQKEYLVCRKKFDNFFATLAQEAGAQILVSHAFVRKEGKQLVIKDSLVQTEKRITPDIVIAADGPLSPTAKAYGMYHPAREHYFGMQALVEGTFNTCQFETYFGVEVCPELFAWVVPESSTVARVGLGMRKNSREYFSKFMGQQGYTVKEMQAGTIPVYHPQQKLRHENCYLLGDAAGFVKATTLGGLVPGLRQAEILADCLLHGKDYRKAIASLAKKMKLHLRIRTILDKFSDPDWDKLVGYIAQEKVQRVFEKFTRDNPVPLVAHTLLREPRLLGYAKHIF